MPEISRIEWDGWLAQNAGAHLLQSGAWGELKSAFGWQVLRWIDNLHNATCGAQLLFRHLPLGYSVAYIPRGPVPGKAQDFVDWNQLLPELDQICRAHRAIFLRIEPDHWEHELQPSAPPPGMVLSRHSIQPPRTILIDLSSSEDVIIQRMKQKTRYNIRLAEKKGVTVYPTNDLAAFYGLMTATGGRDGFGVHSLEYYQKAYDLFAPSGNCQLLQADFEGQPLAALMVFYYGERAWYLYGASSDEHR
jgi:lipid II:glycine glycyltransferase (peptidoglycan interpeptide bridge formation enzyme)